MAANQALKTELFSALSKQGFHDDIKKQLRAKLIEQLKQKKIVGAKSEAKQLFKRVLSSLIIQELQISQSPFTESVYSIQSGFEGAHMTRNQLIQLLTFKRNQIKNDESLLQYILRKNQPFSSSTMQSIDVQTNPEQIGYTLEQKLMMVDQQYRTNLLQKQNLTKTNIFDRKRLELQLTERYKKQIDLFKEFQTHKIKIKVSQQWRIKFQQYSNELADQYRRKYDLLRKKDKQLNEEYLLKHNQFNLKMNESQKIIKQKIQMLDMKSSTIQAQMHNLQRAKKDYQEQSIKKDKQVAEKIRQYDNLTLNIKQKIKYQVNLAKLSIQQQYQQKEVETLRRKKIIDEEYGKLMGIKDSIEIVEKQNARLSSENSDLRNRLTNLQKELKTIVLEVANKVQRIQVLKDDLTQATDKNRQLQERVKEELKKSKRYESQIISMREELQRLRSKSNITDNVSQLSQSSIQVQKNPQSKKFQQINKRLERMKNQRKRDIEKFKLQL